MALSHIPTNIITGFLGVGKTTAISHLLDHKPPEERWAVLVNEFGEVGIDGAMLRDSGAFIQEVPGGCMCCVAGVPMQVALNMLLARSKPDRLLIEPTGLGHPEQIIHTLTGEVFGELLDLRGTLTLVDPRKIGDARYTTNTNFQDQLLVADIIVANKVDLCSDKELKNLYAYVQERFPDKPVHTAVQGAVKHEWLDTSRRVYKTQHGHTHHTHDELPESLPEPDEAMGFVRRENRGQGYASCGWVYHPSITFDFDKVFNWLAGLTCDRVKAVMITDQGIAAFNAEDGVLRVLELDDCLDSRLEIINSTPLAWQDIENEVQALRL
jgi:G3E family GTPase